jgi:hypothetical protein
VISPTSTKTSTASARRLEAPTQSHPTHYALTFRRGNADEQRLHEVTEAELQTRSAELWPAGWRLRLLRGHAGASGARYSAVWRKTWRSEISGSGVALAEITERYARLWDQGWRLRSLQAHRLRTGSAEAGYTAVWESSTEPERQIYDAAPKAFAARQLELTSQGWRLKALSIVTGPEASEPRYTAVWRPSLAPQIIAYGLSQVVYQAHYERLWLQGWRLQLLAPYAEGGRQRVTAVWTMSPSPEIQMPAANLADLETRYRALQPQGWRLALLEPYVLGSGDVTG